MKLSIEEIGNILTQNKVEPEKVQSIIKDCEKVAEEIKADKDPTSKSKYEFVIILNDKENVLAGKEIAGWVVQQEITEDAGIIITKLESAATNQNEASKQKKTRIQGGLVNIFSHLKSKFLKEKKLKIKTKDLTRVIVVHENVG